MRYLFNIFDFLIAGAFTSLSPSFSLDYYFLFSNPHKVKIIKGVLPFKVVEQEEEGHQIGLR